MTTTATLLGLDRPCQILQHQVITSHGCALILDLEGDRAAVAVLEGQSRCYQWKLGRVRLWRDGITIGRRLQGSPDWRLPRQDRLRQLWSVLTESAKSATAPDTQVRSLAGSPSEPNLHDLDPTVCDAFQHLRDELSNSDGPGRRDEDAEGV